MSYTHWLRRQVELLEEDIRRHSVFENDAPASIAELRELRVKAVIHTYLKQQLARREAPLFDEEYDTQEFMLVGK